MTVDVLLPLYVMGHLSKDPACQAILADRNTLCALLLEKEKQTESAGMGAFEEIAEEARKRLWALRNA